MKDQTTTLYGLTGQQFMQKVQAAYTSLMDGRRTVPHAQFVMLLTPASYAFFRNAVLTQNGFDLAKIPATPAFVIPFYVSTKAGRIKTLATVIEVSEYLSDMLIRVDADTTVASLFNPRQFHQIVKVERDGTRKPFVSVSNPTLPDISFMNDFGITKASLS